MAENTLDLVGLLDLDAQANRVDGGLNEHALVLVAGDREGVEEHFLRYPAQPVNVKGE